VRIKYASLTHTNTVFNFSEEEDEEAQVIFEKKREEKKKKKKKKKKKPLRWRRKKLIHIFAFFLLTLASFFDHRRGTPRAVSRGLDLGQ
jgi:polyferredoxin